MNRGHYCCAEERLLWAGNTKSLNNIRNLHFSHPIRNSLRYVASKDQKTFMADLKPVYRADTRQAAEIALDELEAKWGDKYEKVIRSWREKWHLLSA